MCEIIKLTIKMTINIVCIYIFVSSASAKCSKEDIDYYLEKGFTTEQISAMCTEEIISTRDLRNDVYNTFSDEYADEQDEEYLKKMRIERQVFLKSAIGAQRVKIKGTTLSYESEKCGRNSIRKSGSSEGSNIEGCSVILTLINLSDIEVSMKQKREKIIFGTKEILVKGDIKFKIIGGLGHLSSFEKKILEPMILKKLKNGEARIPVRKGLDFNYALENFIDIVDFHKGELGKKYLGSKLGGKLDVDDLNLESQNDFIIEKEDDGFKFSNEKDESIDGALVFDDLPSSDTGSSKNSDIPADVFN
tara:strand:- start:2009 stop:2923 length:915 start_codon:yes stop_codon:yes gene_type:complete